MEAGQEEEGQPGAGEVLRGQRLAEEKREEEEEKFHNTSLLWTFQYKVKSKLSIQKEGYNDEFSIV